MPTGYTSDIYENKDDTFEGFILKCAGDISLPVVPDTEYHDSRIEELVEELAELNSMPMDVYEEMRRAEIEESNREIFRYNQEKTAVEKRYKQIIAQTKEWKPPTPEHQEFQESMLQQLKTGLDSDVFYMALQGFPTDWRADREKKINGIVEYLEYHEKERKVAIDNAEARTAWQIALLKSIGKNIDDIYPTSSAKETTRT